MMANIARANSTLKEFAHSAYTRGSVLLDVRVEQFFLSKRRYEKWAELLGIMSWSVKLMLRRIRRVIIAAAARVIFITTGACIIKSLFLSVALAHSLSVALALRST
jgi:hypothetical protein